jgi:methylphosphotriester-DNA--protein-cysteine methyltransferase
MTFRIHRQTCQLTAVASRQLMPKARSRTPRIFTEDHRKRLRSVIRLYLHQCYRNATAARVSEFAAFLGKNRDYMSRTAAAILGMSLRQALRAEQLAYAAQLLQTTPLPMTATFYRCFMRLHQMPPATFREVMK